MLIHYNASRQPPPAELFPGRWSLAGRDVEQVDAERARVGRRGRLHLDADLEEAVVQVEVRRHDEGPERLELEAIGRDLEVEDVPVRADLPPPRGLRLVLDRAGRRAQHASLLDEQHVLDLLACIRVEESEVVA